ncbi:hypothetical protein RDABS01_008352 [Bienertia sinuspersici]
MLGKGHWKKIADTYVTTRTTSQVARHAQNFYMRLARATSEQHNMRASVFDAPLQQPVSPYVYIILPLKFRTNCY